MGDGIWVAASGALAQEIRLETTATNLANASTDGYQRLRPVFREVLARASKKGGDAMHFVATSGTVIDTSPGEVHATGNALDVVPPKGAFLAVVSQPGKERYTRAGALKVGVDGTLTTATGAPIASEKGTPIVVPKGATISIAPDGSVRAGDAEVARVRVVSFARPELLVHEGAQLLAAPAGAGAPTLVKEPLQVGALEGSNAPIVTAMTDLVTATRSFEAFQRAIETFRELDRRIVTTVPEVR